MANFDFDVFKKKAGAVADKSVLFAKKAADKAVVYAKITKINAELVSEKDKLKKAYQEIGKIYYDLHKDAPDAEFVNAIEDLENVKKVIKEKKSEIETLKSENSDVDVNVDIDDIIDVEAEPVEADVVAEDDSVETAEDAPVTETEEASVADDAPVTDEETQE